MALPGAKELTAMAMLPNKPILLAVICFVDLFVHR